MCLKYNVGLVGYGFIGKHHCNAILKLKKYFNLKVIFEKNINPSHLKFLPNRIKVEKNFTKNNIPNNLDIIIITTPSYLHIKQANIAIDHAKLVVVEKPLGLELKSATKLINKSIKNKKKILVVKQLRLNPIYKKIKKLLEINAFGKIHFISLDVFLNRSKKYFSSSNWKGNLKLDGGTLFNQISHYLDLFHWFFGDIKETNGFKINQNKKNNEDSGHTSIFFKNKVFVSINYSIKSFRKNFKTQMNIISDKCNIEVYPNQFLKASLNDKNLSNKIDKINNKIQKEIKNFGKGFESFYNEVFKIMKNKKNVDLPINKDALKSFEILFNVSKKMKTVIND